MHDNAEPLPDVRFEDMTILVRNHADMTALDKIMSHSGSSNRFNNYISADTSSSIR